MLAMLFTVTKYDRLLVVGLKTKVAKPDAPEPAAGGTSLAGESVAWNITEFGLRPV